MTGVFDTLVLSFDVARVKPDLDASSTFGSPYIVDSSIGSLLTTSLFKSTTGLGTWPIVVLICVVATVSIDGLPTASNQ